jgi:hypothetical protein
MLFVLQQDKTAQLQLQLLYILYVSQAAACYTCKLVEIVQANPMSNLFYHANMLIYATSTVLPMCHHTQWPCSVLQGRQDAGLQGCSDSKQAWHSSNSRH